MTEPNKITETTLQEFLRRYEWSFQPVGSGSFLTGWQGKNCQFPLEITLLDTWVSFRVAPLLDLQFRGRPYADLVRYILDLNLSVRLVRIGMDSKGVIELSVDVMREGLTYETFSHVLGVIGYYADTLYDEVVLKYCELSRPVSKHALC